MEENQSVYERICRTRRNGRATSMDYITSPSLFTDFCELHGDRAFADDHAVVGGIARLRGIPVTVIGIEKGRDLHERMYRNFGCVLPEGYRKALRLIREAEKFHRPVICFVDTQGANCGKGAEERGAGEAIAQNLYELSTVKTPIISLMIGEGGSGGALALAVADREHPVQGSRARARSGGASAPDGGRPAFDGHHRAQGCRAFGLHR